MANPAPTINQINAFNATQGTTIDFNIIGGTELVRSNRIYIYDLSDNSLICTHLYVSTESIHELPPNTDGSIVYESGKSSADFVNGAQYYAQIQTFTDIAGTEGGSGLSVAKMFWCLVDPTLTITTIPSTISTTSYNVSATYNANTSVVSNIIQQYQFSLYSATGSLLQSSGVVVGSGTQQGTSTAYDISYNFTGLSVGSSYYVVVDVTTTQGMSVSVQSNTFTVSIDTPTLGEATVVNNACDGYISVTSNLSSEYGGSGSGEIVSFETDSENVFTKLQVDLEPVQDLHGYDAPWVGGAGKNLLDPTPYTGLGYNVATGTAINLTQEAVTITETPNGFSYPISTGWHMCDFKTKPLSAGSYHVNIEGTDASSRISVYVITTSGVTKEIAYNMSGVGTISTTKTVSDGEYIVVASGRNTVGTQNVVNPQIESGNTFTPYAPYSNICPISGHDEVGVGVVGKNLFDEANATIYRRYFQDLGNTHVWTSDSGSGSFAFPCKPNTTYTVSCDNPSIALFRVAYIDVDPYALASSDSPTLYGVVKKTASGSTTITTGADAKAVVVQVNNAIATARTANLQIELGTPATAYEPYTAETIHKEIEATYTPTVQENEPYQFKRTGDVGGDRESIELVGGSVAWNQLVQNGDFSTESNWSASNATKSISSGICTFTATAQNGNICTSNPSRIFPSTVNNHKYFALAEVKLTTATTDVVLRLNGGYKEVKTASNTNWQTLATVYSLANSDNGYVQIMDKRTSGWDSVQVKTVMVIDLTQLFGSTIADYIYTLEQANAGAGVAFFRKYFPKSYYPYDAGTIKSVEGVSAHKTVGFNQWDEEWELGSLNTTTGANTADNTVIRSKNYIPILPNTAYYVNNGCVKCFYDADKNYISNLSHSVATEFTTPTNAYYMRFRTPAAYGTTYKNDICINLSWDGERNGEYEPYVEHSYPLDSSLTLRGIPKIANGKLYYDGDTYRSDGSVSRKWTIRNIGTFTTSDMSNLSVGDNTVRIYIGISSMKPTVSTTEINILADKLNCYTPDYIVSNDVEGISENKNANVNGFWIRIAKSKLASNDYAGMKSYFTSNPINVLYELKTPTTETAEPFESIQEVTPNYGTEEFVTNSIVPVGNNTQYLTRDIYGGYIDLVSGELVATMGIVDLSTLPWTHITFGNNQNVWRADAISNMKTYDDNVVPPCIAEKYVANSVNNLYLNNLGIAIRTSGNRIFVANASSTSSPTGNLCYELATPQTYQLTPQQIQTLVGQNNVWSDGEVSVTYNIPITNLLVKRQDVADVSGTWLTLHSQPITQASDMDFTFIDFLNQYGKTYKYALVPLLTQTQSGVEVEVEGGYTVSDEVQSVFDGVFIADSTGSQKCKANVGYGNVDTNQVVGSITPIGAKYPIVITNSKNQYHNGSISGTIVPDDYYFNGNLSRIDMVNKRNELEQFLTNKRAKIIKDWNGNIWLVMIMDNVSCTFNNNYGMGIVNFNTNWVEVGDPTNQQDLQATGLINVGGV